MTSPTNTGIVAIRQEGDGTSTALVCTAFHDGRPIDVTAVHRRRRDVEVDSRVTMLRHGELRYSAELVHVYADDAGVVHVLAPLTDEGPLMRLIDTERGSGQTGG